MMTTIFIVDCLLLTLWGMEKLIKAMRENGKRNVRPHPEEKAW